MNLSGGEDQDVGKVKLLRVVTMPIQHSLLTWAPHLDNPTFIGWSVVAGYFGAAACCCRAALRSRSGSTRCFAPIWRLLVAGLVFLGINKQLNVQTLMIVVGRNLASAGHWYGARRRVQLIFSAVFAAASLGALAWFWWRCQQFFSENRFALAGVIVLALFVILRAATISHANELLGTNLKDEKWAWVLRKSKRGVCVLALEPCKSAALQKCEANELSGRPNKARPPSV